MGKCWRVEPLTDGVKKWMLFSVGKLITNSSPEKPDLRNLQFRNSIKLNRNEDFGERGAVKLRQNAY